jgi:hypothetical protein
VRCTHVQKRCSAFVDGDMSAEEMAAIRGHMRRCELCEKLVEEERALVAAAGELDRPEPPTALWRAIQERIAEEEIAESEKPPWRLWMALHWRPVVGSAAACAAALVLWMHATGGRGPAPSATAAGEPQIAVLAPTTFQSDRVSAIDEAEQDYRDTVFDLREMVELELDTWTEADRARYRELVQHFDDERARLAALADAEAPVRSRDRLWASYRTEIDVLEGSLFGQVESLALAAPEVSP